MSQTPIDPSPIMMWIRPINAARTEIPFILVRAAIGDLPKPKYPARLEAPYRVVTAPSATVS